MTYSWPELLTLLSQFAAWLGLWGLALVVFGGLGQLLVLMNVTCNSTFPQDFTYLLTKLPKGTKIGLDTTAVIYGGQSFFLRGTSLLCCRQTYSITWLFLTHTRASQRKILSLISSRQVIPLSWNSWWLSTMYRIKPHSLMWNPKLSNQTSVPPLPQPRFLAISIFTFQLHKSTCVAQSLLHMPF